MGLVDFLLVRIAEDEAVAHAVPEVESKSAARIFTSLHAPTGTVEASPARVLAECEAKRRIVELSWHHLGDDDYSWGMEEAKRQTLALLALPYSDHPDYDEAWRL